MRETGELVWHELRADRLVYGLIAPQSSCRRHHPAAGRPPLSSLFVLDVIGLSPRSIVADPRHPTAWLGGVLDRRCVARILAGFALLLASFRSWRPSRR
jgi:hypothetical protein